jgi:hypothetical protein
VFSLLPVPDMGEGVEQPFEIPIRPAFNVRLCSGDVECWHAWKPVRTYLGVFAWSRAFCPAALFLRSR